ncbi:MAG: DUF3108 domain-containing protein [Herminiimonas sp.]|uniref:DUF3108 domain-containing protein n=1 Tax=Herminiimonas sp. TaxID=1926289 RepID=UPI0027157DF5|nr:DUF3108 domain-containing protein [Herminiimonas sp.]MDO9421782.1 DUF3108 domain-containing protein [Herminiimonas sp.]MDO9421863.1 DUF3108 domain-containing protein [Herminiimonas sp.]
MTMDHPLASAQNKRASTRLRRLSVLVAAVVLHLITISWFSGALVFPKPSAPENTMVIAATLEAPPAKPVIKAATQAARPKLAARKTTPRVAKSAVMQPANSESTAAKEIVPAQAEISLADQLAAQEYEAQPEPASDTKAVGYQIDLPPSADLKYDVQKISKESPPMYGSGTISWHTDGSKYTVNGDFGVLFITALRFQSTGVIEDIGIAPELYSEKRFRKAETNTHFHRERNTISFSSSTLSYPRTGGEQDRASIVWQLAGIGRGDSAKFIAGSSIDLFVAGTRNAETWQILIIGQEDITIDGVTTRTWHIARAPRVGSHEQKLDIWLAPEQNWYPVRLRYTETNGDYLDMTLTSLNVSAIH